MNNNAYDAKIIGSSIEFSVILRNEAVKGIDRLEESLIGENARLIKASKRNATKLYVEDYSEAVLLFS